VSAEAGHDEVHALIERFAAAARRMHTSEDFDESLQRITDTAVHALRGCEAASISLVERDGPVTRGATSALALAGDQIQYEENEGPCLDAAMEEPWVYTPDLTQEPRCPRSAERMSSSV
jgi:GAF domain-containing protein